MGWNRFGFAGHCDWFPMLRSGWAGCSWILTVHWSASRPRRTAFLTWRAQQRDSKTGLIDWSGLPTGQTDCFGWIDWIGCCLTGRTGSLRVRMGRIDWTVGWTANCQYRFAVSGHRAVRACPWLHWAGSVSGSRGFACPWTALRTIPCHLVRALSRQPAMLLAIYS